MENLYLFRPCDGGGDGALLFAHELKEGCKYFILPTTAFGLYRYHIHDLVRVTGFHHQTPLLEFLGKGAHFSSLTGEKLSEYHVTQSMLEVVRELDLSPATYALAPCWDDQLPYYGLFIERGDLPDVERGRALAAALDRRLMQQNVEYADKRRSLRLGPIRLELLAAGAWAEWDRRRLKESGGTAEQYKHPCLIADPAFRSNMAVEEELVVDGSR